VATVFTGVAALAGGYAPTAFAATTQATPVRPDIGVQECGANNGGISNWVHLYYPNGDHPAECFHGKGFSSANATIASFCPGNNSGTIYGSVNGTYIAPVLFYASSGRHEISYWTGYREVHISGIRISKWTGDSKCG
jgi:hypothetical protein